jgi:DnaJ-class molecular chaperone
MEERSLYRVLGVAPDATTADIRGAYRDLAWRLHPDRQGDATEAETRLAQRRMREVNEAWAVLRDPAARVDYDRRTAATPTARAAARTRAAAPRASQTPSAFGDDAAGHGDDEHDDIEVSHAAAFLLRRGPAIVAIAVAAFLLVVTAYAGPDRTTDQPRSTTTTTTVAAFGP